MAKAEKAIDPKLYEEAVALLRSSPTRQKITDHFYWPWKRKAEAFVKKIEGS